MKKEFIISVELDDELEKALYNIRWKHIDIDKFIEEELQGEIKEVIKAYGEVELWQN